MMKLISKSADLRGVLKSFRATGRSIGCVPTMGALHDGHISLVETADRENDIVVVSIFVNPTQFNDHADLNRYPRTIDRDRQLLEQAGVDVVFVPTAEDIYKDNQRFSMTESPVSTRLEGMHRPGHFEGVMTVVMKLLCLIQPDRAYFGEKDWQQFVMVRDMAEAFFLETEIVPCPVVREPDGLAMSSRNMNLTTEERSRAPVFPAILSGPGGLEGKRRALDDAGFNVDYVERWNGRILGAVGLGKVRLIDNFDIPETEASR